MTYAIALLALAMACAPKRSPTTELHRLDVAAPGAAPGEVMAAQDRARLQALVGQRAGGSASNGYRIGPDDLLEVRIPDLLDGPPPGSIQRLGEGGMLAPPVAQAPVLQQGFRVDALGEITLPLLGQMRAAGLTPTELAQQITQRLVSDGLLQHPQVSVLVSEYRSRVVAVVGSVERPGLYPLTRPAATLADLIWAAGGPTKEAGRLVAFVPASEADGLASGAAPNLGRLAHGDPIRIDLELLLHPAGPDAVALNPPVRPGDLISVSPAGNVHVDGWVEKPGSYPVTRTLTLSGAVAAAGGRLFPADSRHVSVKRVVGPSDQRDFTFDLQSIATGQTADPPITDGDVVSVPLSIPRLVPYGAWQLVTALVHVGGTIPLF